MKQAVGQPTSLPDVLISRWRNLPTGADGQFSSDRFCLLSDDERVSIVQKFWVVFDFLTVLSCHLHNDAGESSVGATKPFERLSCCCPCPPINRHFIAVECTTRDLAVLTDPNFRDGSVELVGVRNMRFTKESCVGESAALYENC